MNILGMVLGCSISRAPVVFVCSRFWPSFDIVYGDQGSEQDGGNALQTRFCLCFRIPVIRCAEGHGIAKVYVITSCDKIESPSVSSTRAFVSPLHHWKLGSRTA